MTSDAGMICAKAYRKVRHSARGIVGFAGDPALCEQFMAFADGGEEIEGHFSALILLDDGTIEVFDGDCYPVPAEAPFAIGSGAAFALGAMEMGADPLRAVEIAAMRDTITGGEIYQISLDDATG